MKHARQASRIAHPSRGRSCTWAIVAAQMPRAAACTPTTRWACGRQDDNHGCRQWRSWEAHGSTGSPTTRCTTPSPTRSPQPQRPAHRGRWRPSGRPGRRVDRGAEWIVEHDQASRGLRGVDSDVAQRVRAQPGRRCSQWPCSEVLTELPAGECRRAPNTYRCRVPDQLPSMCHPTNWVTYCEPTNPQRSNPDEGHPDLPP